MRWLLVCAVIVGILFLGACAISEQNTPAPTKQQLDRFGTEPVKEHTNLVINDTVPLTAKVGLTAPDFQVQSTASNEISLQTYKGKTVLLYFMATWCPFCDQDFKALSTVIEDYPTVNIVVISLDLQENAQILSVYKNKYPKLKNIPFAPGTIDILTAYNVRTTTTKFLIGADGVVQYNGSGAFTANQWKTLLGAMV